MADTTKDLITERTNVHGEFMENSRATWGIIEVLRKERNWSTLTSGQKHALYMISHKMARIMAGDANYLDHWDDIAGYARCVSDRIREPVEIYNPNELLAVVARGLDSSTPDAETWLKDQARQRAGTNGATPPDGKASAAPAVGARELPRTSSSPTRQELDDRLSKSIEEELNKGA